MLLATSIGVAPLSNSRIEPSGNVILIIIVRLRAAKIADWENTYNIEVWLVWRAGAIALFLYMNTARAVGQRFARYLVESCRFLLDNAVAFARRMGASSAVERQKAAASIPHAISSTFCLLSKPACSPSRTDK